MAFRFCPPHLSKWIPLPLLLSSHLGFAAEWVVKFREVRYQKAVPSFKHMAGVSLLGTHDTGHLALLEVDTTSSKQATQLLQTIQNRADVEYMVPNIKMHAFEDLTGDPQRSKQWSLLKVQAEEAWRIQRGARKTIVAVIDTGVDYAHEDLKNRIWNNEKEIAGNGIDDDKNGFVDDTRGWNFFGKNNNPMDETSDKNPGHGTHCSGIIGAQGDNDIGISGIAPNISIMPVRFLGADGSGDLYTAALAIDYATNNGADVISASWGAAVTRDQVKPILEAIERAGQKGVIFVAAAANDGKSNDTREVYPANAGFKNVISVAASNSEDQKPSWSNYGAATVDLAAPGADIFSTLPDNKYGNLSGTSMATPLVAGMVALLKSQAGDQRSALQAEDYKAILQATGDDVNIETACKCRVNMFHAVQHIVNQTLTMVPNAATLAPQATLTFKAIGGKAPYRFTSSHEEVASIDPGTGVLTAKQEGELTLTVTDADGTHMNSRLIRVSKRSETPPPGECPLGDPALCALLCTIQPTLPWCHGVAQ
jgi:thermitase